jgi:hypothetical protein
MQISLQTESFGHEQVMHIITGMQNMAGEIEDASVQKLYTVVLSLHGNYLKL